MATVYQARDTRLDRTVALKIIHPEHASDANLLRRLTDEAKTVARLAHPNVVAVYDQGVHEGAPYIVMEYVHGRTLREVLNDRRRLDPSESLAILEQVLAALAVAHRSGLVHRDVKPENILISPPPNGSGDLVDAVVKVADFGLARAVDPSGRRDAGSGLLATAEYVAPELVADGHADPRADLYSAGIVLFEMITGRVPFDGQPPAQVAWQHVDHDVPAPSRLVPGLPPLLDGLVARATRRDPAGRPRDAAAMLAEIQSAREEVGALAGPTRALAHPTVVVSPVGTSRPSWARLPEPRRGVAAARKRVSEMVPSGSLSQAWNRAVGRLDRIRATQRGQGTLIAALVVIGLLLGGGGWWLAFGRYTEAPSLVQLTKANAISEASRLGFEVDYGPGRYDENTPIDTVMEQRPQPGGRIVRGGTITLTLSLGPERYPVPDVVGQAQDYVTSLLKQHFVVQTVKGYSDTLPVGYVVGTDPAAGTPLKPNSVVKVIVAQGGFPVHVPSVVGKQLAEAEATLRGAGFDVDVQRRDDQGHPHDQVLEQNPPAGQGIKSANGVKVVLIVANGPPGPPMPAVVGWGCNDAVNNLRGAGMNVNVNGNQIQWFFWHVLSQDPQPNTPLSVGQTVTLQCG
jgi:serine/threonine-protein kinase